MKLFIGCGSSNEVDQKYKKDCEKYLKELLKEHDLVFGAYDAGLMGIAYKEAKKDIYAVTTEEWKDSLEELTCKEKIVEPNILRRTETLFQKSDALIFLPGGIGTFVELFSAIDMKRNHEMEKPIILYNSNHYFDLLIEFLEKNYQESFTPKEVKNCYHVSESIEDTQKYLLTI